MRVQGEADGRGDCSLVARLALLWRRSVVVHFGNESV
ncbi:uncharacterized protein METZ01_LOCUS426051, partial [marine metagenome]